MAVSDEPVTALTIASEQIALLFKQPIGVLFAHSTSKGALYPHSSHSEYEDPMTLDKGGGS